MSNDSTVSCKEAVNDIWRIVLNFHLSLGLPIADAPQLLASRRTEARSKWMREELDEFDSAVTISQQADAMVDLMYLAIGTLVEMGVPPGRVFEIVHDANMAKRWPDGAIRLDEEGKILKPPAWASPDQQIEDYVLGLSSAIR
jgi:predicted HAD superfamily Cof-like phosphohydrolase